MASQAAPAVSQPLSSKPHAFLQTIREAFREPHPFGRTTAFLKPHSVPWFSVYLRRQVLTAGVFIPFVVTLFGWPYLAKALIQSNNGVGQDKPVKSHKAIRRVMLQEGPMKQRA